MAIYPVAISKLIPPGNDPRITARVVILHVAVSESDSLYDQFTHDGGIEAHFYVRYTGVVEQYRDTAYQADANMAANDFAISVETEGLGAGSWTAAQLTAIKALLWWCHTTHGIPLVVCPAWNGAGVGYHILFMSQWAGGPRACPGPARIAQFHDVLVHWMSNPTTAPEDFMATLSDTEKALVLKAAQTTLNIDAVIRAGYNYSAWNNMALVKLAPQVAALTVAVAAVEADPNLDSATLSKIFSDALAARVEVHGTLTVDPKTAT